MNRKILSPEGQIDSLIANLKSKYSKLLFYAGQFDRYAGLIPYDRIAKKYHSPYFTGTHDALYHLDNIASRNNWAILFKPHPLDIQTVPGTMTLHNTFPIPGANIFDCIYQTDLIITILSTVCYMARIHNRPVVMLGKNQISRKGCVYEICNKKETGNIINKALTNGITPEMQQAWEKHIAQLLKYYLFPFETEMMKYMSRSASEAAQYLIKQMQLSKRKDKVT